MFTWHELYGETAHDRSRRGGVEFAGEYRARRKPLWFILLKLTGIIAVVLFVFALALRHVAAPITTIAAVYFGGLLIYGGLAYLIRPRADDTNMGWAAGFIDDPTQISDDINRSLINLECLLQPGQIAVEAVLDLFVAFGLLPAIETPEEPIVPLTGPTTFAEPPREFVTEPPSDPSPPVLAHDRFDRFERRPTPPAASGNYQPGETTLSSWKYMNRSDGESDDRQAT